MCASRSRSQLGARGGRVVGRVENSTVGGTDANTLRQLTPSTNPVLALVPSEIPFMLDQRILQRGAFAHTAKAAIFVALDGAFATAGRRVFIAQRQ